MKLFITAVLPQADGNLLFHTRKEYRTSRVAPDGRVIEHGPVAWNDRPIRLGVGQSIEIRGDTEVVSRLVDDGTCYVVDGSDADVVRSST